MGLRILCELCLDCLNTITAKDMDTAINNVRITINDGNSGTAGVEVGDCVELGVDVDVGIEVAVCKGVGAWVGVGVGVAGAGVGLEVGAGVVVGAVGLGRAWGFEAVKMGKKFIVPSVKSYLKSYIVSLIA